MTDELTPELENVDTAPDEATTEPSVDDGLPDKFKGKSPAEIAKAYEELERKAGEQGRQFGEYKQTLEQLQSELAYYRNAPKPQQPQEDSFEKLNEKFYENPAKVIKEVLSEELGRYDRYQKTEYSRRESPRVLAEVKKTAPELFSDPEIEKSTMQFLNYAVQQGGDPAMLADPTILIATGATMKYYKDRQNPTKTPVSPVETESPSAVKSQTPSKKALDFTDTERSFLSYIKEREPGVGIKSMKDAAELMEKES